LYCEEINYLFKNKVDFEMFISILGNFGVGAKNTNASFGNFQQQKVPMGSMGRGTTMGGATSPVGTASPTQQQSPKKKPNYTGEQLQSIVSL
jgi:hypothetical protein